MNRALDTRALGATRVPAGAAAWGLAVPQGARRRLARGWLWMAMLALATSGLFSILLVLSRTPGLNRVLRVADFFRVALVVHVDLSVLVWFVAVAGILWTLCAGTRAIAVGWAALLLCGLGTLVMALAPFLDDARPVMANYIPVLDGPVFLAGLVVFAGGAALLVLRSLWAANPLGQAFSGEGALRFGLHAAAVAGAVALLAFAWSIALVPRALDSSGYYEILFWGGGHALQFVWTLLMLVGWMWLADAVGAPLPLSPRMAVLLFALALACVFVTPYAYLAHDIASVEHRHLHTWAMRLGGGVSIAPVGLAVVFALRRGTRLREPAHAPLRAALVSSMCLFAAGGLMGGLIAGNDVRIPAHYHGCIVGVTLALMGLVYLLLPRLGARAPHGRLATWQPALYGGGQLLHILGLVWSGGYGVQRKVAGAEQVLRSPSEIAGMGLMGLGGAVAIVGGVVFVLVVARAARPESRP